MGKTEQERQRLKDLYSHMADGELEEIAQDSVDLTDLARKELGDELARRGIRIEPQEEPQPKSPDLEPAKLVTVSTFGNLGEAFVASGLLQSAGISCFLFDAFDNSISENLANPIGLPSIGGIELRVVADDAEVAKESLAQPVPLEDEETDTGS